MECVVCYTDRNLDNTACGHKLCSNCWFIWEDKQYSEKNYSWEDKRYSERKVIPCPMCRQDINRYLPCNYCNEITIVGRYPEMKNI